VQLLVWAARDASAAATAALSFSCRRQEQQQQQMAGSSAAQHYCMMLMRMLATSLQSGKPCHAPKYMSTTLPGLKPALQL
jgi:hypothetical protein